MSSSTVRVGGVTAPIDEAREFVRRYLTTPEDFWAYPAYDDYPGGPSDLLSESDLLAPALLNAPVRKLATYYGLRATLPIMNERLATIPVDVPLEVCSDADLEAMAQLIGVLSDHRVPGVRLTTLSKIIHRKRPAIFPLYDAHILRCYQEVDGAPVPVAKGRTWTNFARAWLPAVQADLASQLSVWEEFAALTPSGGPEITPLRALDIVGWWLGKPEKMPSAMSLDVQDLTEEPEV